MSLGTVVALYDHGAGDVIEIAPSRGESLLLPFTRAVVPVVDLEAGSIEVVPPAETVVQPSGEQPE